MTAPEPRHQLGVDRPPAHQLLEISIGRLDAGADDEPRRPSVDAPDVPDQIAKLPLRAGRHACGRIDGRGDVGEARAVQPQLLDMFVDVHRRSLAIRASRSSARGTYPPNKTCENGNGLWTVFPVSVISIWSSSFTPSRAPTSPQYTSRQSTMFGSITRSPFG